MIQIENIDVYGWKTALRGMRNPMNSWRKNDTKEVKAENNYTLQIGYDDLNLAITLCKAGREHRKFLRQVYVSFDITAPLYWWKEFDTYKIGVTSNSCSTMHKLHEKEIEDTDFSCEWLTNLDNAYVDFLRYLECVENMRKKYVETKSKDYWDALIQMLPSSYNQKRTIMCNMEALLTMVMQRRNHKLREWNTFCKKMKENVPLLLDIVEAIENEK